MQTKHNLALKLKLFHPIFYEYKLSIIDNENKLSIAIE